MTDRWMIKGREYFNCNCAPQCPCQSDISTSNNLCQAICAGIIDEGHFNDLSLDGLRYLMILQWPGDIADGNGRQQAIIDQRAKDEQREALRKIIHGESTTDNATHYHVFNATMSEVLETIYAPVSIEIDVRARRGRASAPGLVQSQGDPIINPLTGTEHHPAIKLPDSFEYTLTEMGTGTSNVTAGIRMNLKDTHGQFNITHINQDGPIQQPSTPCPFL